MENNYLTERSTFLLDHLCRVISTRRLGTQGNRDATAFFRQQIKQFGFITEQQRFTCIDSQRDPSSLCVNGQTYEIYASPFSLACDCQAELVDTENISDLEKIECEGKILLLHGDIAKEQLMPKGFEFYNPEEHKKIYRLLEKKRPAAILCATSKNPELAGAVYPFPMIADGDFDIPSAYMKDLDGNELINQCGQVASISINAKRVPSIGENIVARKGNQDHKIVICAHIDTKENTPGALDNASGIVILLLLAELLTTYKDSLGVEIVAFNGEEYYNTPGEVEYLKRYNKDYSSIVLAINLDDIGYIKGRSAFSFYGVPENMMVMIRAVYENRPEFFEGPPWYQSDHGIFMSKGIPAMAITEENVLELMAKITHTEEDVPAIIKPEKLVQNAVALRSIIESLDRLLM